MFNRHDISSPKSFRTLVIKTFVVILYIHLSSVPLPRQIARPDGQPQFAVRTFPRGLYTLLFPGCRGEVWTTPGEEAAGQGAVLQERHGPARPRGDVSLVLGAGNHVSDKKRIIRGDRLESCWFWSEDGGGRGALLQKFTTSS